MCCKTFFLKNESGFSFTFFFFLLSWVLCFCTLWSRYDALGRWLGCCSSGTIGIIFSRRSFFPSHPFISCRASEFCLLMRARDPFFSSQALLLRLTISVTPATRSPVYQKEVSQSLSARELNKYNKIERIKKLQPSQGEPRWVVWLAPQLQCRRITSTFVIIGAAVHHWMQLLKMRRAIWLLLGCNWMHVKGASRGINI